MRWMSGFQRLVGVGLCLVAGQAAAQPLIEHVPADAWFYVGWAGTGKTQQAYEQSALKGVLAEIDTAQFAAFWGRAEQAIQQKHPSPDAAAIAESLDVLWRSCLVGPCAMHLLPSRDEQPPTLVITWSVADEAQRASLLETLEKMQEESKRDDVALLTQGDVVQCFVGPQPPGDDADTASQIEAQDALAQSPGFRLATADIDTAQPFVAYANLPALTAWLREVTADTPNAQTTHGVYDALHLEGLGPAVLTAGFAETQWQTAWFVSAPAPRKGLAALLDAPALQGEDLAIVPADATWVRAFSFDPAAVLEIAREVTIATSPQGEAQFAQAMNMASGILGVNVEERVVGGLGAGWVLYLDADGVGSGFRGITLANRLRDPEGVATALRSLQALANMLLRQQIDDPNMTLKIHEVTIAGKPAYTFPAFFATPALTIVEDRLLFAFYPQVLATAIERVQQPVGEQDPLPHAGLRQALEKSKPHTLTGVAFTDLPRTAPQYYGNLILWEQMLTGTGTLVSGLPAPTVLPPLGKLMPHLSPTDSTTWVDDAGWHRTSQSPFPGAMLLGPTGSTSAASTPLTIGILLPALGAARRTARVMQDNTQASAIHQAMIQWSARHDQRRADDIGLIVMDQAVPLGFFLSNADPTDIPPGLEQAPLQEQADWVRRNASFILVPAEREDSDPQTIAIFIRPHLYADPPDRRGGVVYGDGTVTTVTDWSIVDRQLDQQTGMTVDELIFRQAALAD